MAKAILHMAATSCCMASPKLSMSGRNVDAIKTQVATTAATTAATTTTTIATQGYDVPTSVVIRRSADYQPSIWGYNYIQSLQSDYMEPSYKEQVNKLEEEVKMKIGDTLLVDDPLVQLELIDVLQRLGISYHFNHEIHKLLETIYNNIHLFWKEKENDLYAVALAFRLLRQHNYNIPQGIFGTFIDESGDFKQCLGDDTKAILCLYEASYLLEENESILEKARDFTTKLLRDFVNNGPNKDFEEETIRHALELPLHWRMPRLESRWFIDHVYGKREDKDAILLELAILDFNMVQAYHQEDLKSMSRWWKRVGLAENLSFTRDRLMEHFLWTIGIAFEPQFTSYRRSSTQVIAFITAIDDIYDVYGTFEELKLFTDVVERWDINAMDQLPYYMKMCFSALYNSVHEMAFNVLKEQGIWILSYIQKSWADLCKAYLLEAKWYYSNYTPSLQEYIDNACISVGAPLALVHAYFCVTNPVTKEALDCLQNFPEIIRSSSIIFRLSDDLATSSEEIKRGDVPKSIQCYMHEMGASEEKAREHIKQLISTMCHSLNKEARECSSLFSRDYINIAMNVVRMGLCMYQLGDGHASQNQASKDRISSLLIQPILRET